MKLKTISLIAVFLLLAFLLTTCKKPQKNNLSEETKTYIMQPAGSWWVYEDSISGEIDSVVLISSEIELVYHQTPYIEYEKLTNLFYSSKTNKNSKRWVQYSSYGADIYLLEYGSNWRYIQGLNIGDPYGCEYVAFYNTYEMDGEIYENVKVFGNEPDEDYPNYIKYFWAENIGLIRKSTYNSPNIHVVWKLKNYHINNE